MKINRIVGMLSCALTLAACNDVSHVSRTPNTTDQAADGASRATVAAAEIRQSTSTLPEAVPVPPASSSPIVTGEAEEPKTSTETPVTMAKADAATTESADTSVSPAALETPSSASPSSAQEQAKGGTDSAATQPLSSLSQDEQSKSMPMALHGNNHSSPSVEQRATN